MTPETPPGPSPETPPDPPDATPDIRAYLEIRTAAPSGFSPDGSKLLISTDLTGTAQLWRVPVGGGDLTQLTDLGEPVGGGYVTTPPETDLPGDRVLVAMDAGGNERHQLYLLHDAVTEPARAEADLDVLVRDPDHIHRPGGVTRDGTRLAYATNRRNGVDFDVRVRSLDGVRPAEEAADDREVFAPGGWCGAAGFSPDGRWLAVSRLTERAGDNEVHLVDLRTGESFEVAPHDAPSTVGGPSWLPDASAFFFSTDVGRDRAGVARFDLASRTWEYALEPGWDAGCAVDWTGQHLLVAVNEDGYTRAALHDPVTLEHRADVPLPGPGVAGGMRFSRDGRRLGYQFTSGSVPGDTWVLDVATGDLGRLTTSPCEVDPTTFVEPDLVRFASFDGEEVPAFVFRPRGAAPGPRPVVVVVHGGPESQYRPSFAALTQYLVARGFAVVAPNVRGSTGYGKRYEHLDDVRKRLDSVRDLAALHDWIATSGDLDAGRTALYGGSYGGYMVLAGLTMQPERWAAGVSVVGISSLVTFLENTSPWRRAFREREYGSLEHDRDFLEEVSPLTHLDRLRAPLFLVHGANDPRVPVSEAEQIHARLRGKGVRSELLVYHDEGHGLARLANRLDAYPRVADFLTEVLRP